MKRIYFLPLLIVGLRMGGCKNDKSDWTDPDPQGDSKLKLSLTLPPTATPIKDAAAAPGTRADHEGVPAESKIEDIYIFVFDQQGNLPSDAAKGKFKLRLDDPADFTRRGGTSNVFDMVDPVITTSGIKTIFVAANMDENSIATVGTQNELLSRIENVHIQGSNGGLIKNNSGGTAVSTIVFMGSNTATLNSVASGLGDNIVEVEIERTVSRVVTTSPDQFEKGWSDAKLTLTVKNFLVAQDAYKSYLGQNFFPNSSRVKTRIADVQQSAWNTVLNPYIPDEYIPANGGTLDINDYYIPIVSDPGSESQRAMLPCFYIGENASNTPDAVAQHGNTTYAWIQTQLTTDKSAAVSNGEIKYTGGAIQPNTDFYLVRVNGVADYLCWLGNLDDVKSTLSAMYPGNVVSYKYPKGYVYYRVFLNKVDENGNPRHPDLKYNVYRNQFIHLDITDLNVDANAPGGFGKGYPGDENEPEVPIDPFDPNDPGSGDTEKNPEEHKPEEPIDEDEATLKVNITVKEWTYSPNGVILE